MAKSIYLRTQPDKAEWSLPFSDKSGNRLKVSIDEKRNEVMLEDVGEKIFVAIEDIEWLREVLDDVKSIVQMNKD